MIPLTPVVSSNIAAQGYDPATQTLAIRFNGAGDKVYQYKGVPPEVAEEFASAKSIGRAFIALIRNHFEHTIVLDDSDTAKAEL